jgi:hypothetical protein
VDGQAPGRSGLADVLRSAGFVATARGYLRRAKEGEGIENA